MHPIYRGATLHTTTPQRKAHALLTNLAARLAAVHERATAERRGAGNGDSDSDASGGAAGEWHDHVEEYLRLAKQKGEKLTLPQASQYISQHRAEQGLSPVSKGVKNFLMKRAKEAKARAARKAKEAKEPKRKPARAKAAPAPKRRAPKLAPKRRAPKLAPKRRAAKASPVRAMPATANPRKTAKSAIVTHAEQAAEHAEKVAELAEAAQAPLRRSARTKRAGFLPILGAIARFAAPALLGKLFGSGRADGGARTHLHDAAEKLAQKQGIAYKQAVKMLREFDDDKRAEHGLKRRRAKAGPNDARRLRGEVISKLMREEGWKLGEASRYLKEHPELVA